MTTDFRGHTVSGKGGAGKHRSVLRTRGDGNGVAGTFRGGSGGRPSGSPFIEQLV